MNSRRKFLKNATTASAAAIALNAFPPSIRRALAIPANNKSGTIMDVEHVVILMQENRSFDHYFGTLPGVRGFGDRFPVPLAGGKTVWQQSDGKGNVVTPYHLDQTVGNAQRASGCAHGWTDGQGAWNGGRMDQWVPNKTAKTMGYYQETELPFQFALAKAFTVCDAYHCGLHSSTNPNRSFHWTGTNGPSGETSTGTAGIAAIDNRNESIAGGGQGYNWTTYPERLQAAGVSWIVYQNLPDNFTDNPLAGFQLYRAAAKAKKTAFDDDNHPAAGVTVPAYDPVKDDADNALYKGVANTMPDGGFLTTFSQDIKNGKLPQVSWIIAPKAYCEHPSGSSPIQGGWYVEQVLNALTASPEVWSKTVLIVNFDENDGYFDHMPSPAAPSLNTDGSPAGKTTLSDSDIAFERNTFPLAAGEAAQTDSNVFGPGPRVPMYIVSPWSVGGWVNSQVFDHTSVLRFLEARFAVAEKNISPFRRAVCGDLTTAFDFTTSNSDQRVKFTESRTDADQLRAKQEKLSQITPPVNGGLPAQPAGTRPSRALPYELNVSAKSDSANGGVLRLTFTNSGKAAAVFHVYDKLHLDRLPRRYMVEPGKTLDDIWNAVSDDRGAYDLWVLGPNGFHRAFQGALSTRGVKNTAAPEVIFSYDVAHKQILLTMINRGDASCVVTVRPNAYRKAGPWTFRVPAGMQLDQHWPIGSQNNWYDFTATVPVGGFSRRFAGRMETGEHGVSDPAMGMTS
jgi:phospholipase C